jgi:Methyltransferase FkbM domain
MNYIKKACKAILPHTVKPRVIPFGLAKGIKATIDFEYDTGFFFGRHERELFPYYRRYVTPGTRCFDVGGYRGWDALIFAKLSGGANILTFESNENSLTHMRESFKASGYSIDILHGYVGSKDEPNTVTIDDAAEKFFKPDFIKMDIEGHEVEALKGAQNVLSACGPGLVIEVHSRKLEEECRSLLQAHGYSPTLVEQASYAGKEFRGMSHNRWLVCDRLSR